MLFVLLYNVIHLVERCTEEHFVSCFHALQVVMRSDKPTHEYSVCVCVCVCARARVYEYDFLDSWYYCRAIIDRPVFVLINFLVALLSTRRPFELLR